MSSRCLEDEYFVTQICKLSPNQTLPIKCLIYDARSYLAAYANRVKGGGFENTKDYYRDSDIVYCDIENIHAVRDALTKVYELGAQTTTG